MNPSSEIPIRTQGTRREPIVFWFSVHAEKLGSTVVGFIPMFATKTLITNVTKVVRSKNSLKCSTANKFRKERLSLILDQKLLTMAAPNRLLELISEIDRLLHEKEMRLKNVRREASRYVIEAAEKKAS